MEITSNYKTQANIRVEFYTEHKRTTSNAEEAYWNLYGFLTDEGLDLSLENNFKNALDFGLLEMAQSLSAGIQGLASGLNPFASETGGYITGGLGENNSIILNAPYFWQGTNPINFSVPLYQIADNTEDIMINYQRILEILSPTMSGSKKEGESESITLAGTGPGLVFVHYFPEKGEGQGKIILGPCLCQSVSMKIAPPYNASYMPIIGIYNFKLLVSRILDREQIAYIFNKPERSSANKTDNNLIKSRM